MSMIRPIARLAALIVALGVAASASAQGVPTSPGSSRAFDFQPFLDPGYFQPDFQFFAPAEVNDFGGEDPPNTGIYVTFDRTYVNVSRPRDEFSFGSGNQGDFTWGNRMEVGYMTEEDKGWQATLWHVNGPNELFANTAANVFLSDSAGANSQFFQIDQGFDSINQLKMSSFELNRVWRRPQFHNGTQFEPLVGYRYMNVRDFFQRQNYLQVGVNVPPLTEFFALDTRGATFENQMHGGQLGARLYRQRGHWMLSADVKFFAFGNFQSLRRFREQSLLNNPDSTPQVDIIGPLPLPFPPLVPEGGDINRFVAYDRATQFVFGGEVRGEASYELTRDINLRVGFVFMDLGQGIGRGNLIRLNNQAVQMAGVTFGFTVNR